jgi:hypothetical protein
VPALIYGERHFPRPIHQWLLYSSVNIAHQGDVLPFLPHSYFSVSGQMPGLIRYRPVGAITSDSLSPKPFNIVTLIDIIF